MMLSPVTLFDLQGRIKELLKVSLERAYWVVAEISELKENIQSGHCYLELVENDETTGQLRAKARATIWAAAWRMVKPYFQSATGKRLEPGLRVLLKVSVEYHEFFGLSLNVTDIEPTFTIGELARRRQEVINRLEQEGVIDMNTGLSLPMAPQRIAVISSGNAAGFGDFHQHLLKNSFGYTFFIQLFQATMQGDEAEESVINALESIFNSVQEFDAVVVIRGGGSQTDLDCFNGYRLALHVAQFPLPVITGIGHEKDETVLDLVAYRNLKTPTAVAEFFINLLRSAEEVCLGLMQQLANSAGMRIEAEHEGLLRASLSLKAKSIQSIHWHQEGFIHLRFTLKQAISSTLVAGYRFFDKRQAYLFHAANNIVGRFYLQQVIVNEKFRASALRYLTRAAGKLEVLENKQLYLDPGYILKRGYTLTYLNGGLVGSAARLAPGDEMETLFADGRVKSRVTKEN